MWVQIRQIINKRGVRDQGHVVHLKKLILLMLQAYKTNLIKNVFVSLAYLFAITIDDIWY